MLRGVALFIYAWITVFFLSIGYTNATATNRTIDDEFGDSVTGFNPTFLPVRRGIWEGQECTGCRVQPDTAKAFKGTWNAATFRKQASVDTGPISIDLKFNGTAIYVYLITANDSGDQVTTLTECNFTLDGEHADFFQHMPNKSTKEINYNVLAFSRTNLSNTDHSLNISTGGVDYPVFLNFDYAIYTFDDGLNSSPPNSSVNPPTSPTGLPTIASSPINQTISKHSSTLLTNIVTNAAQITLSTSTRNSSTNSQDPAPSITAIPTSTNEKKNNPLGNILGGTLGGLVLIIIALFILRLHFYWKKQQKAMTSVSVPESLSKIQAQSEPRIMTYRPS